MAFPKGHPKYKNAYTFQKGHIVSDETKNKIKEKAIGRRPTEEARKKMIESHKGQHSSPKTEFKIGNHPKSEFKKGKNHPFWNNGSSFEPYGLEFNEDLKEVIRNRDRRKCKVCGKTELEERRKLTVHHIDYNKKNCNPNNLITLCNDCHLKTNHNRNYWINYFICQKE